jgi:hypothetical protein
MRGSLPVHARTLLVLCGWSVWGAVHERVARLRASAAPGRAIEARRRARSDAAIPYARSLDPRRLPN